MCCIKRFCLDCRFRSITKQYFRKADGIMVFYDVTSEISFKNVRNWITNIQEGIEDETVLMLLGNKVDLLEDTEDKRVVKTKHGSKLAEVSFMLLGTYQLRNICSDFSSRVSDEIISCCLENGCLRCFYIVMLSPSSLSPHRPYSRCQSLKTSLVFLNRASYGR